MFAQHPNASLRTDSLACTGEAGLNTPWHTLLHLFSLLLCSLLTDCSLATWPYSQAPISLKTDKLIICLQMTTKNVERLTGAGSVSNQWSVWTAACCPRASQLPVHSILSPLLPVVQQFDSLCLIKVRTGQVLANSSSDLWALLLGESDLQVRGQILPWCEGVLPHHHVWNIIYGEA